MFTGPEEHKLKPEVGIWVEAEMDDENQQRVLALALALGSVRTEKHG